jgi:hypothetical protein
MNVKRSLKWWMLSSFIALPALLLAVTLGYQQVTGQPLGGNTIYQTDAPSGTAPAFRANGSDANISINLVPKGTGTVQINGTPIVTSGGAGVFSTITVSGTSTFNGPQITQIGTSGVTHGDGGIPIFVSSTDQATTGTVLQNLYTFTLPANSLSSTVNQRLRFKYFWLTAANANNKTTTITFGATTIFNSTAAAFNNAFVQVDCDLFVTGANTQKAICVATTGTLNALINGASANVITTSTTPAETTSGPIVINVTGTTPTAIGDLTAKSITIDYYPQP